MNNERLEYLLGRVGKAHRYLMWQSLEDSGLHRGQPLLLSALHTLDGMSHSELAEKLEVAPPTISNMVKRLERRGLVERRRDENDERVSRVFLTEEGSAQVSRVETASLQIDETAFAGFSAADRQQMRELLERVLENLRKAVREGGGHRGYRLHRVRRPRGQHTRRGPRGHRAPGIEKDQTE